MPNSLDALQRLQQTRLKPHDTLSMGPEGEGWLARERMIPEVAHNLDLEKQFSLQGHDDFPASFDGSTGKNSRTRMSYASGATPSDLADLLQTQKESAVAHQMPEVAATEQARQGALRAGFTGTQDIAKDYGPDGQVTAAGGVGSPYAPEQQSGRAASALEAAKVTMPAQVEALKVKGQQDLAKQSFERAYGQHGVPTGDHLGEPFAPAASHTQGEPPQSQSWPDFLMGSGKQSGKYNHLGDLLGAASERLKASVMNTPYAPLNQDISFANLQQLSGQFPGIRGFSYLLPKLAEHQANFGKETWDATYQRLAGMDKIMGDTAKEFDDPSLHFKTDLTTGHITSVMPPQTVVRGKLALEDAHTRIRSAMQRLRELKPGIEQSALTGSGMAPSPSHGSPSGKVYLDDNGNPQGR